MKSFFRIFVICSILVNIIFTTCDNDIIGLGQKVVTLAPTIDTTSDASNPNSKAPGDFLYGEENLIYINADSEGTIKYVTVTYSWEEDGVEKSMQVLAIEDKDNNYWIANIDTTGIPDGTLRARIEASDTADRVTVSTEITYTVKNKPPFINMLIPNVTVNFDKADEYNTKMFDNDDPPTVVMDSYLSGVYDDLAGIAKGYPLIKFWKEGTPEPTSDRYNAGYWDVLAFNDDPNDGWINADDGLVKSDKGAQAGSFKYFIREHKSDGTWYAQSDGRALNTGIYKLKLLVKDMTGKVLEWPKDAYTWADGTPDSEKYMKIKIIDQGLPPQVTITGPTEMYLRDDFTVEAEAVSSGSRTIAEMCIEVEGKNKLPVTLHKKLGSDLLSDNIEMEIKIGKTYYSFSPGDIAIEVDNESLVPYGAYSSITFVDGNFNFTVIAISSENAEGKDVKSIYIDRTPPKTEITRVSPIFSQDAVNVLQMAIDLPAGYSSGYAKTEDYRRWTVNSSVAIEVNTTDNRGNATTGDANNYIKFKYLFLKDNDIEITTYSNYIESGNLNRYEFSKYLYGRTDAKFFEETAKTPVPVPLENGPNGNPLIKVTGEDGAYTLTLQTRKYDTSEKYKLWFYVVALDNAGNASFQKILLNVDQTTDIPNITFGNINADGSTFMDDKYSIRFGIIDDNGLDGASSVKVRFAKNVSDRDSLNISNGGWFTLPRDVSEDKLSISIDNLKLIEIARRMNGESYTGTEELDDPHKILLGNENDVKYIQIQATDSIDGKIYTTDGQYTKISEWRPFRIDLTYPVIVPSTKDTNGITIITRSDDNPFIAPEKEGSYTKETDFTAWGDIIEQNISSIEVKIDGKTPIVHDIPSDPVYNATAPAGNSFAVWRTVNAGWAGELRFRIPFSKDDFFTPSSPLYLQDGSHTFEISFFDKAGQYATKTITFYIDTRGPDIDVIIPSGEKISLTDTENITPEVKTKLLANSIKDVNAKLIGSFNDSYSPVFSADNKVYWYKLNSSGWTSTSVDDYLSGSKSAAWQILIPDTTPDGVYTISLRVKDSRGNGYDNVKPISPDDTGGYLNDLAFMLDRNVPQFKDVIIESEARGGEAGFIVTGTVYDTYSINNFDIRIAEKSKTKVGATAAVPGREREFTFSYWIKTKDDTDFVYGSNNVTISVTGSSGQSAVKTLNFILDDRGPEISFNTTGGEKIYKNGDQVASISLLNVSAWTTNEKNYLYETRIKEKSSSVKLSGRFSDDYTAIPASNGNYTFWYRIDGPGNVSSGTWTSLQMTATSSDSRSVPWEVPISPTLADGIYRLSIAVRDRSGNGYYINGGNISPTPIDGVYYGYETNMAFMLDRSAPSISITGMPALNAVLDGSHTIEYEGSVSGTYEVKNLSISVNGGTPETLPIPTSNGVKSFTINQNTLDTADLEHGPQIVVISVTGSSDQTKSITYNFIVDIEGPVVTISGKNKIYESELGGSTTETLTTSLNSGSINPRDWAGNLAKIYNDRLKDNSAKLTLSIYDDYSPLASNFEYKINEGAMVTQSTSDLDINWSSSTYIKDGLNKLTVIVNDANNNETTEHNIVFMVDIKDPILEVSGITQNGVYGGDNITISGVVKNVFDVTRLSLIFNGTELDVKGTEVSQFLNYAGGGFPFSFTIPSGDLTYGSQSVLINATGSSGKSKMNNYNIIIDTKGPEIEVNIPSGEKIYLENTSAINSITMDKLLLNSVKDANAKLTGSFNDEYSSVFTETNNGYWYKIIGVNEWSEITVSEEEISSGNKSIAWQVPIPETLQDGVYLLSLRVKDSLGNGYGNTEIPGNNGEGYINNLAFILDRSIPQLTVDPIQLTQKDGNTGFYVTGNVTGTYSVNNFDVRVKDTSKLNIATIPASGERTFAFNYWVQTQGDTDFEYGSNNVSISLTGSSGQSAVKTQSFILDNRGPEISFNTTGGQKIILSGAESASISAKNVSNSVWNSYREFLYETRIKDKSSSAKLSGRFSDDYTAIPATDKNYTFWYKIDGPGAVDLLTWQSIETTAASADSKSVPWEIPIPTNMKDGIYRLSIAIKDRIGNGYYSNGTNILPLPEPLGATYGYETNMAFMIDRNPPALTITGTAAGTVINGTGEILLSGSVEDTFAVQSLYMSINGEDPVPLSVTVNPDVAKTFAINNKTLFGSTLSHGVQNIVFSATGSSDQTESKTISFIVDKVGPVVTISGKNKIYENVLGDTVTNLNLGLDNGSINPRVWTGNLALVYNERLKDNSTKLTLSIYDDFSPPLNSANFTYSINGGTFLSRSISTPDIPWSSYAGIREGLNTLDIKVSDSNGNETIEQNIVFMVDREVPILDVSGVTQNGIYSGKADITITGVVKNVYDVSRLSLLFNGIELEAKGTEPAQSALETDSKPASFNPSLKYLYYDNTESGFYFQFTLPSSELTHGTHSVLISAAGSSGQSKMNSYNIVIDNKGPEIKFMTTDNPIYLTDAEFTTLHNFVNLGIGSLSSELNAKNVLLAGSSIKDISARLIGNFIDDYSFVFDIKNDGGADTDKYGYWYKIDKIVDSPSVHIENGAWTWNEFTGNLDSTSAGWQIPLPPELTSDGYYRISLRVKDRLGNGYPKSAVDFSVTETENGGYGFQNNMAFMIERSIPKITVAEVPSFLNKDRIVTGTITDTTAVSAINISMGGNQIASLGSGVTLTPAGAKTNNFSFTIPTSGLEEKSYSVMITVEGASGQSAMEVRNFTFDKTAPEVMFNAPTVGTMKVNGLLSDNGKYSIWWSGLWVTGQVKIGGVADDKNGIDKIYYHLGKLTTNVEDGTDNTSREAVYNAATWTDTALDTAAPAGKWSGGLYYWNFTDELKTYLLNTDLIERNVDVTQTHTVNMFYLPFYVKIVDRAGNINIVHYKVYVDPDMDIPHASISTPSDGVRVGGEVRISGTATDNNWVHSVDIRIKDTVTGSWYKNPEDDWVDEANGWIKAKIVGNTDTTVSWYYSVNADGKLNPDTGMLERPVQVQVRAWDTKEATHQIPDLVSGPSVAYNYYFDSGVPTISVPIISKTGNPTRVYTDGIRVSGNFKISAVVQDDGGISSIRARRTGNSVFKEIVKDGVVVNANLETGWNVIPPATVSQSAWESGWRYYIVNPGTLSILDWSTIDRDYTPGKSYAAGTMIKYNGASTTGSGATAMKADGIRANIGEDLTNPNSANWNSQFFKYTVEFDITSTSITNLGYGKTGIFTLELDVYDNNKEPAPYSTRGTFNMGVDNYYPTTEITTQYSAATKNFYVMGTAQDYDTQSGSILGLERLLVYFEKDGVYYNPRGKKVNDADPFYSGHAYSSEWAAHIPAMTTWSNVRDYSKSTPPSGYGPNEATFTNFPLLVSRAKGGNIGDVWESPHAMVIDGQELGETVDTDGDGTYAEMWDGRVDKVWQAKLDTTNLPEGPITVHYIVMDQAGNASHYTDKIYIGNNRPLIRSINLGTDINGNGSLAGDEYMKNPISVGDTIANNVEHTTNFRVRNSRLGIELEALYGNIRKHYRISYVTRGTLVKSTDMERGKVYTIAGSNDAPEGPGNTDWTKYGALSNNSGTTFVASGSARSKNDQGNATTGWAWQYTDYTDTRTFKTGSFAANSSLGTETDADGKLMYRDSITTEFNDFNYTSMLDTATKKYDTNGNMVLMHDKLFIIKVYDTTVPAGAGITEADQLAHVALINVDFDNQDGQKPLVSFKPFYWNSLTDNSVYESDLIPSTLSNVKKREALQGHIELSEDLPAAFNQAIGINDRDPKISGKVSFRGTAFDNIIISKIYFAIGNHSNYGVSGSTVAGGTYYLAASFSGGTWTTEGNSRFTGNGWKFTIERQTLDQDGHSIDWRLDYDSSFTNNRANTDNTLTIIVQDSKPATPNDSDKKDYRVDIVPYITNIVTKLSDAYNPNPSAFSRSAQGWYPVREDELITIEGFNLFTSGNPTVHVRPDYNSAYNAANVTNLYTTGQGIHTVNKVFARVDNDVTNDNANSIVSGYLVVRVNNIDSINNINNNTTADYNKEENGLNNDTLTDDRALYVWNMGNMMPTSESISSIYNPFMRMDSSGNRLMSYGSYYGSQTGRLRVSRNNTTYDAGYGYSNRVFNTTIAINNTNSSWYAAGSDQSSSSNQGFHLGMSDNTGINVISNNNASAPSLNPQRITIIPSMENSSSTRFKIPRIAVQPTGATRQNGTYDRILMSYFDDEQKVVNIIYGTVGTTDAANIPGIPETVATNSTANRGSMYTAAGFLKNGLPVVAWYDSYNRRLLFSWGSGTPTAGNSYNTATSRVSSPATYTLAGHGLTASTTDIVLVGPVNPPTWKAYVTNVTGNNFSFSATSNGPSQIVGDPVYYTTHISVPSGQGTNTTDTGTTSTQFYTFAAGHGLTVGDNVTIIYNTGTITTSHYVVRSIAANGANFNIKFATNSTTSTATNFFNSATSNANCAYVFVYPEKNVKSAPIVNNTWQTNAVVIDNFKGTHVDMAVDGDDNVHLAYCDVSNGGLYYALIPYNSGTGRPNVNKADVSATVKPVKVDTYLSAGTKIMINVRLEGTAPNQRYVPYISYAHASFAETENSVRVAWRTDFTSDTYEGSDNSDAFTGKWEVMTVPTNEVPNTNEFICNGVPTSATWTLPSTGNLRYNTNTNKSILVGYMTDRYYEGAILKKALW